MSEKKKPMTVEEIMRKLEEGVKDLFTSEKYQEYLRTMSLFSSYSFNNTVLIAQQNPNATLVAGYQAWMTKFGRKVKPGERGIRIIAPMKAKAQKEIIQRDPNTHEILRDENGEPIKKVMEVTLPKFKVTTVFDVSQTEGKPLPTPEVTQLQGRVPAYKDMMAAIQKVCPVPISFDHIPGQANGYFDAKTNKVVIKEGLSEMQIIKTAIHEATHANLHSPDMLQERGDISKNTKEVEAESVAYTVCQHFGLETSEYSFGYIASWSQDKELRELRTSMDRIRKTSATMIQGIEEHLQELEIQRNGILYEIYQIKEGSPGEQYLFMSMETVTNHGWEVKPQDYERVYSGKKMPETSLDELYMRFNIDHPSDFTGRSVSVSDVIVIYGETTQAFYVDSIGFQELPDFVPEHIAQSMDLAVSVNDLFRAYDVYAYNDAVEDPEAFIDQIQENIISGNVHEIREEVQLILRDEDVADLHERASQILEELPEVEREESIRYFVAENISFPVMGAYTETDSLEEAKRLYDALPMDSSNRDRGIGAILEQKNGVTTDIPLFVEGKLKSEHLENALFKESASLKEAFSGLEKIITPQKTREKTKTMIGDMER